MAALTSLLAFVGISTAALAQQPMPPEIADALFESAIRPFYSLFLIMQTCEQKGWSFSTANLEAFKSQIALVGAPMTQTAKDRAWTNANAAFDPDNVDAKAVCDQTRAQVMSIFPKVFADDPVQRAPF